MYDALLVKAEYPTYGEELFYDRAGNRTRGRSASVEEVYVYDAGNHLTKLTRNGADISFQYDRAGNLLNDDRAAYSYDAFNRQTAEETFDGNIQINRYDAEGLRAEMEENGRLVQFIFRRTEVVVEETQEENIRYIRTHELLASDAESARTYYHYASDEMGSITHVTDEEGNLLNLYEYDAWGNLTAEEEQVSNRFKYTGEQFDAITQQYYLRARFYNPSLARFMQEDTYRGDGLNLYAYCANNPVRYVDPSGHWCEVKQNAYERLVKENGFDINNIDPDTKLRFMAEAANIVKGLDVGRNDTIIELPEIVSPEQNRPSGPVADMPNDGRHGEGGSKSGTTSKTVYRGDRASVVPEDVFQNGFSPKGTHNDALLHTKSNATAGNFVSTSGDMSIATDFGGKNGYVYVIQTDNYVDINATYGAGGYFPEQIEFSIPGGIKPSEIVGAYKKQGGKIVGDLIPNPNFGGN